MQNQSVPPEDQISEQTADLAGSLATTCSPSSDTPRTDGKVAHLESKGSFSHARYQSMIKFCKKLEHETTHSRRMQKKLADRLNDMTDQRDKAIECLRHCRLFIVERKGYIADVSLERELIKQKVDAILPENAEVRHGAKDADLD